MADKMWFQITFVLENNRSFHLQKMSSILPRQNFIMYANIFIVKKRKAAAATTTILL
jgi:hypothetical protein